MTNKKNKVSKINKKELIITIVVLIACIIVGVTVGKYLYEMMYGTV